MNSRRNPSSRLAVTMIAILAGSTAARSALAEDSAQFVYRVNHSIFGDIGTYANTVEPSRDGTTVNRWITTGFLAASATTNETAWCTYKVVRGTGMLVFDNQARV